MCDICGIACVCLHLCVCVCVCVHGPYICTCVYVCTVLMYVCVCVYYNTVLYTALLGHECVVMVIKCDVKGNGVSLIRDTWFHITLMSRCSFSCYYFMRHY